MELLDGLQASRRLCSLLGGLPLPVNPLDRAARRKDGCCDEASEVTRLNLSANSSLAPSRVYLLTHALLSHLFGHLNKARPGWHGHTEAIVSAWPH